MMAAFADNDAFQKTAASGGHIRTAIVTLKDQLDASQADGRRTWPEANNQSKSE